jgi:2-octaprenyl-6-methoxyphenol hydroxylase
MTKKPEDIILIGGGLTAKCLALMLSHSDYSFVWLNQKKEVARRDTRTTTIHHAGMKMLSALGVWDKMSEPACPIHTIAVAKGKPPNRSGRKDWPLSWHNDAPAMAYVIRNAVLSDALDAVYRGPAPQSADITSFERTSDVTTLTGANGSEHHCHLAIACDGSASTIRSLALLKAVPFSMNQTALVSLLNTERPLNQTAYQRFLPGGPLAIMPTTDYEGSLVWSMPDEAAQKLAEAGSGAVSAALQNSFGDGLGKITICNDVLLWPLKPAFVPTIGRPGLILAGDAAHALHPLAGMGFNLALADIAELADCLKKAHSRGLSAGHLSVQHNYSIKRRAEIVSLTAVTQSVNWLFSKPDGLLSSLCELGFVGLGVLPVKNKLKKIAMGGQLSRPSLFSGIMPF